MTFLNPLARQRTAVDLPRESCSRDCHPPLFLLALGKAVAVIYHTMILFVPGQSCAGCTVKHRVKPFDLL